MTKINYGEVMQNFREEIEALSKKDERKKLRYKRTYVHDMEMN